jgi:hypothetical protein
MAVIVRSGLRTRPASTHPAATEATVMIARGDAGSREQCVQVEAALLQG